MKAFSGSAIKKLPSPLYQSKPSKNEGQESEEEKEIELRSWDHLKSGFLRGGMMVFLFDYFTSGTLDETTYSWSRNVHKFLKLFVDNFRL